MPDRNAVIAETLPNYHRWLHRMAYDLLPGDSPDHDDLAQEGYVAMWRAFDTYDESKGALATWLTGAARMRMRDVAYGHGQWFGHEPVRGHREVEQTSLEAIMNDEEDNGWAGFSTLEEVELAYHHGEILAALDTLSPSQRQYVYARYWLGIDPTDMTPTMKALKDEFPVVRKRWLWNGSTDQVGARDRLATALAHLSVVA